MPDKEIMKLIILAATVGSGRLIIACYRCAFNKVFSGQCFLKSFSLPVAIAYVAVVTGASVAYSVGQWWFVGCVGVAAFVFVELLYATTAAYALMIALPVSVIGLVFSVFYI